MELNRGKHIFFDKSKVIRSQGLRLLSNEYSEDVIDSHVEQQTLQSMNAEIIDDSLQQVTHEAILEDGYFKHNQRILPAHQKINIEDNKAIMLENTGIQGSSFGSKQGGNAKNITQLKNTFGMGFSFQRLIRKCAVIGVIFAIVLIVFVSAGTAWAVTQYNNAPNISEGALFNIEESSVVYAKDGKTKIYEFFDEGKREYKTLDEIPEAMQLAILALEDQNFYYNQDGIPWSNILGKIFDCAASLANDCAGGSGISQQLVKNVQDDRENSLNRKIRELFTAIKLYQEGTKQDGNRVNKSDILELYLNWVPFSRNSFGVEMASKSYFGHGINERENPNDPNSPYLLTPPKACYLAALVQQQSAFNLAINDPESQKFQEFSERKDACLYKLAGEGRNFNIRGDGKELFIKSSEELTKWQSVKVDFIQPKVEDPFPHFREYVQVEIVKFLNAIGLSEKDLFRRGLRITTSLDPDTQRKTEEVLKNSKSLISQSGGDNAAAIVLDGPTGQIAAMAGSLDYFDTSIKGKNNIMLTPQQPGSSIKPYIYAMAFDQGFNPGTIVSDTRTTFVDPQIPADPFKPNNFGNTFKGNISLRYGLLNSRNIPAVKAGLLGSGPGNANIKQGLENFFNFTENLGLRYSCVDGSVKGKENCATLPESGPNAQHTSRCFAPTFIGACEINGITHATALNTMLQEGNLRTASPFVSIVDKFGQELYTPDNRNKIYPQEDAKLNPLVARQISDVLSDQNRPEFGSFTKYFTIPGWKLAGKTGTTNDNRDTWMVGGSPLYTTVVWAGRTDNGKMKLNVQASNLAAPIWQDIQKFLHSNQKPVEFSKEGLVSVRMSGGRIVSSGGRVEYLTPEQISILKEFGSKVSQPAYNPRLENFYNKNKSVVDTNFALPQQSSSSSSSSQSETTQSSDEVEIPQDLTDQQIQDGATDSVDSQTLLNTDKSDQDSNTSDGL